MGITTAASTESSDLIADPRAHAPRRAIPLLRILAWGGVIALASYFIGKNAVRYLSLDEATYGPYWWARAQWLLPHVAAGTVALVLGPLQFWSALRRRFARFHRWSGRAYLTCVAIGAPVAVVMALKTSASFVYASGLLGLALAWVGTSVLALAAIRRGNVAQHREWMVRSYVVTFGFVTFRVIFDTLSALAVGTFAERIAVASWACWAVPLLVAELSVQGRKILTTPRRALPALPS